MEDNSHRDKANRLHAGYIFVNMMLIEKPAKHKGMKKMTTKQETYREEYREYLMELFSKAWNTRPIDFIYTLLRVSGVQYGHWDPFSEILDAFEDYNKFLIFQILLKGKHLFGLAY